MTEQEFNELAQVFLLKLFSEIDKNQIEIRKDWEIDHLCYRSKTSESYQQAQEFVSAFAELLIESEVSGRLISTFQLRSPVKFRNWTIHLVELPAPKASKQCADGFEHIEVVCDVSFQALEEKYKHLTLDLSGLKKEINKEFEICLGKRNVKFHHMSLLQVIEMEKNNNLINRGGNV